jgi:hypothetical protein
MDVNIHEFLHGIKQIMFHGHFDYLKNHVLEVCLTQKWETMALQNLTTINLLYTITYDCPAQIKLKITLG